jgi:hypothetical protein
MMVLFMWGIGKLIRQMARAVLFMPTVMFMKEIGSVIRLKGEGLMSIWMELSMSEIGWKTDNRGMV